ncbi:hypothetical protein JAAARDRAFT_60933 [Jaapia argillacea MUCL 33604]|uniref:CxC2-like cysteine cluster KDZ transposase-associated domain-containing protein n=1 Tax=Jaapia argillacea MUCL 33604 TaxID=933084 RepID=A0A067PK29_9AGAM|nr:hypothetical protein JAAARDRAFT_60933 [Jaapia argillacea MUCL 33604]
MAEDLPIKLHVVPSVVKMEPLIDVRIASHLRCIAARVWTGAFFDKTSLKTLGLSIQLGHGNLPCPTPILSSKTFLVFDTNGVHNVSVKFCGFIRMWQNLSMLKRAGRGHDPAGPLATKEGELAVQGLACPHVGRNLPDGWEKSSKDVIWLFTLYLAINANFRQKSKDCSVIDVELTPGWAYFVEENGYQQHLAKPEFANQVEVSISLHLNSRIAPDYQALQINTCKAQHDAVVQANTRNAKGHLASGVGAVVCAQHGLVRRNGVGDLQKGEHYCNMDYLVLSTLVGIIFLNIIFSYDIACQWHKNFWSQVDQFPESMMIKQSAVYATFVVLKWHLNAHGSKCQALFSLNNLRGAGRTWAELVEVSWSHTNPVATSAREMGPGARHELLNEHWGNWNWSLLLGFRECSELTPFTIILIFLVRKQRNNFEEFSATFSPETVVQWEKMVDMWNEDRSRLNPYQEPPSTATLNDVRLELAREEAADAARGNLSTHNVSMSSFIVTGLELEEQQWVIQLHIDSIKGRSTSKEQTDLQQKRNALHRRIQSWRSVQAVYMPCVTALLLETSQEDEPQANTSTPVVTEKIPLWLPSALPSRLRSSLPPSVLENERRLRLGQADDALSEVRRQRRMIVNIHQFRHLNKANVGQKANTPIYCAAHAALTNIDPNGTWNDQLRVLHLEDVRGPGKDQDGDGKEMREGHRKPSWIWLVQPVRNTSDTVSDGDVDEIMRLEWAKTLARAERWEEEVMLLAEEMRHVIVYLEWQADWWWSQASRRMGMIGEDMLDGLLAYAEKQAVLREWLAQACAKRWLPLLKLHSLPREWGAKLPLMARQVGDMLVKKDEVDDYGVMDVPPPDDTGEIDEDDIFDLE